MNDLTDWIQNGAILGLILWGVLVERRFGALHNWLHGRVR